MPPSDAPISTGAEPNRLVMSPATFAMSSAKSNTR
jgi:hypothetical protein